MSEFIIRGGRVVHGVHRSPGNKNAALPMLAACLLTDEVVTLRNLPAIRDVETMLAILEGLGVQISRKGHQVALCSKGIRKRVPDPALCRKVRTSLLFAGPMAARHGKAVIARPGGDSIGRRRFDTHLDGLRQLGIEIGRNAAGSCTFTRTQLAAADILLDEASVTATENIIMAAVLAPGTSTIFNAACEPHVQDLCRMLNAMGASIEGVGTNRLMIQGVELLHGVNHRIASDTIEAASFVAAAILTGGELTVENIAPADFMVIDKHWAKLGVQWNLQDTRLYVPPNQKLAVQNDFGAAIPKIEDGPWPNFPSDLLGVTLVLATQAHGTLLLFEKMFESRMYFVDRMIDMGARIVQCDPHRVVVSGPAHLQATRLHSPDIRAGISLLLAALCAKGESRIGNADMIDRGYENVDRKLRHLGADIRRVQG
ncbi:MAG: UDP-N-acetylglucosamine 1-carboxyvinyltransferase [Kiritimatiellia bacterium]